MPEDFLSNPNITGIIVKEGGRGGGLWVEEIQVISYILIRYLFGWLLIFCQCHTYAHHPGQKNSFYLSEIMMKGGCKDLLSPNIGAKCIEAKSFQLDS